MKLLVIVLCLLSERYLLHAASDYRTRWFSVYFNFISKYLPQTGVLNKPYVALFFVIFPILIASWAILALFCNILFGFIGFILSIIIFYGCLGSDNPFYPASSNDEIPDQEMHVSNYFAKVNSDMFAVIFWFICLGPLGIIFYRLLYLCRNCELTKLPADSIIGLLDWVSVRITLMLFLLVGNFQRGFSYYTQKFLSSPQHNEEILGTGALLAARSHDEDKVSLPFAENMVESALIVFLVIIASFTLVAWL